jgi:hypothetical protein
MWAFALCANRFFLALRFGQELKTENGPRFHQNKSTKRGKFPTLAKARFSHHVSPPIHHDLTIKKPRSAPHFSRKPLQKRHPPPQQIFLPLP